MPASVRLSSLLLALGITVSLSAQTTYKFTTQPVSGVQAFSVVSADLNRDGNPDLIAGTNGAVDVFIATGKGVYGPRTTYPLPFTPNHIETPDINNDSYPDLVIASADANSTIMILLNNGDGTFRPGTPITLSAQSQAWVSAGDLNKDGNVDLVVRERLTSSSQFAIYMGHGNGTFTPGQVLNMSHLSSKPVLEDFNGDGKVDIANVEGTKALIWPGNGNGTFGVPTSIPAIGSFDNLVAADFTNDGIIDLAIVYSNVCGDACPGPNNNRVYIFKNNGKAQFTRVSTTDFGGCSAAYPVAADVNGDGNIDLNLVGPSHFCGFSTVALGNGLGGFTKLVRGPSGDITSDLIYRDLNLDSRHDVALTDVVGGDVAVGIATSSYTNCAPPPSSFLIGKICTPIGTTTSPFILRASGNSPSGIKRLEVWIDGVKRYQRWNDQLAKSFTLSPGQHRIAVVAVDKYKGTGQSVAIVNVR
jgi:FG-GAP-like repeat